MVGAARRCFIGNTPTQRYLSHLHGDTLIFNFNYGVQNFGGGYGCGGGCRMGFWGGAGLALGGFLGNLFSGNMWGGNMWGGGMPWNCYWGGGGGGGGSAKVKDTDGDSSSRRSRRSSTPDDIDNPKIADFTGRLNALNSSSAKSEYQKLRKEIEAAKEVTDKLNKESDQKTYDNLLLILEAKENGIDNFDPNKYDFAVKGNEITVKIGGTTINVTPDNLNELEDLAKTPAGRTSLKGLDKDTARMLLLKLGYINDDNWSHQYKDALGNNSGKYLVGKFSNKPAIICLFEAAKIAVEVEKNPNAKDHWFVGTITTNDNSFDENGNLKSFDLKCTVGIYQGSYTIAHNDNGTFTPTGEKINGRPSWEYKGEKVPLEFKSNSNGAKTSTGTK